MKTAVIYYSFEGNCALVATAIKDALNADIFEIKTKHNTKTTGFVKFLWGIRQMLFNKKPELLPLTVEIKPYDLIVLGTPVWGGSPTPAIVSFIDKTELTGKKIALFCCHAGGKRGVFDQFKALLPGNTIVGEIDFEKAAKGESAALKQKIDEWVKTLG